MEHLTSIDEQAEDYSLCGQKFHSKSAAQSHKKRSPAATRARLLHSHSLCSGNDPSGCNYTQELLSEAVFRSFAQEHIDIPMTTAKVTYDLFAVAHNFFTYEC